MSVNWGNFTLLIYCPALAQFRRKRKRTSSDGYYERYIKLIMNIYKNLITVHRIPLQVSGRPLIRVFSLYHIFEIIIFLDVKTKIIIYWLSVIKFPHIFCTYIYICLANLIKHLKPLLLGNQLWAFLVQYWIITSLLLNNRMLPTYNLILCLGSVGFQGEQQYTSLLFILYS